MNTALIGSGAIGSLVAAYLAPHLPGVTLYERPGPRAEQLLRDGLRITGLRGERRLSLPVRTDAQAERPFDLVIVCVKAYQTRRAAEEHRALVGPSTVVISLQNGIGNVEMLGEVWPEATPFAATTTHGAFLDEAGWVHHVGSGDTFLGAVRPADAPKAAEWAACLSGPDWPVLPESDMARLLFQKLAVNCVINPLTALMDRPNGIVAQDPELAGLAREIVTEVADVAAARGISLSPDALLTRALDVSRLTAENRSSMLNDVRRRVRTEIDAINGAVARLGDETGIPTPVNRTLARLVRALSARPD